MAEQLNQTLLKCACTVLHASRLPKNLWGALAHIIWVKNCTVSHMLDSKTLYELLTGKKPTLANLSKWRTCIWIHDNSSPKLDARA